MSHLTSPRAIPRDSARFRAALRRALVVVREQQAAKREAKRRECRNEWIDEVWP